MKRRTPECPVCNKVKNVKIASDSSSGQSGRLGDENFNGSESSYWKCTECFVFFHVDVTYFAGIVIKPNS
jgi:hypothetical protein